MMSSGASAFKPNISRMRLFEAITLLTDQEIEEIKRNLASQIDQDELIIHPRSDFLLVLEKKGVFSLENVGNLMDVLKNIDSQKKEKIMKIIQAPKDQSKDVKKRKEDPSRTNERSSKPSTDQSKDVKKKGEDSKRRYAPPENWSQPSPGHFLQYLAEQSRKKAHQNEVSVSSAKSSSNIDENRTGHNRRNRNNFENIAQQAEHCNINLRRDDRRDDESELFLTPEMREFIAKKLGNDWKRLGIKLGDDDIEAEIEHINEDNRKLLDKSKAMLKYLHESGITDWKSLKVGLDKLPRKDIIRKFEQAWQQGDFG